jgi:pyruvate dehydrogenase E1 component beta subunit
MREITYREAITEAVDEEMARDPAVFLMGEDVRVWGAPLGEFKGIFDKYGSERVLDTPIAETAIMGAAVGAAQTGMRPIANIMFCDFLAVCMGEIMNALCRSRYIAGANVPMPVTIMSYSGAGIHAAAGHSSRLDGLLMGVVGLKLITPATPYDAKGLIKSAIRDDDPVVCCYHTLLIANDLKGEVPEEEYTIPLGKADIKREGSDVTVVATSLMVHRALAAAEQLQKKGISIEVIDPRTLVPLDEKAIIGSLEKTGRLVIMAEEAKTGSAASEIAAMVAEEAFDLLRAPIKRVCAPNTPIPFCPPLERIWMPDEEDLVRAVTDITQSNIAFQGPFYWDP